MTLTDGRPGVVIGGAGGVTGMNLNEKLVLKYYAEASYRGERQCRSVVAHRRAASGPY